MHLATRCPFCETVFRLQPAQLAQHRGLVRCGRCQEVFDASGNLFEVGEGGDFSTAKPVAAAALSEALSGGRPQSPDFSDADAWETWVPAAGHASASASTSTSSSTLDSRLRDNAASVPLAPLPLGGNERASVAPATSRQATEPQLATGAFTAPLPADDEPTLADSPLEPFAYPADDAVDEPTVTRSAAQPAAPAAPPPFEDDAPRVWRKTERAEPSGLDEPGLRQPANLHGRSDNEPHFGAAGTGATGTGATGFGTAAGLGAAAAADTAGTGGPRPPGGPSPAPSSGEPFSVKPPVGDGADPFPVTRETRPAQAGRVGWIVAGVVLATLLAIALLGQLAWWQRETVMINLPRSQALYAEVCAHLGCELTPLHAIEGLLVEPSDLRQIDGPHELELKMPLHNRLNVALAYPAIELTLLDDQNNVAVRRVLWPQDYVPPGTVIANGLPAHATQTMIVHLDTGNAIASNFRVQIFYP